jgi:hypothetical protein
MRLRLRRLGVAIGPPFASKIVASSPAGFLRTRRVRRRGFFARTGAAFVILRLFVFAMRQPSMPRPVTCFFPPTRK